MFCYECGREISGSIPDCDHCRQQLAAQQSPTLAGEYTVWDVTFLKDLGVTLPSD